MTDQPALNVTGLQKRYSTGLRGRLEVLKGLEMRVERGQVYGLLGRNGSGKSTTFRILMALSRPDAGSVEMLGGSPTDRDLRLRVGYCPESPQFPPNLTVMEVLRFHSSLVRSRLLTAGNRVDWLIEQFDLGEYRKRKVHQLSRGGVQRLALALTLLARPELLILDEPFTALDPLQRQRVSEVLRDQHRAGTAMIIASHILSELETHCDRLGVLGGGRIRREIALDHADDRAVALDIRVPFAAAKEARLDASDLDSINDGDCRTYRGVPFERAQGLLREWSAAGVPILEIQRRRELPEDEILAGFLEDEAGTESTREPEEGRV
jgi:ABC-2 type transport system ATP-binding protein